MNIYVNNFNKDILALTACAFFSVSVVHAEQWTGNISGFLGQKSLDDTDWSELDSQVSFGVQADFKQESWPVSIAFDLLGSGDVHKHDSLKDEGYTRESHIGVRKIFDLPDSSFKPYIGGGVAFVSAEIKYKDGNTTTSQDDDIGSWIGGGCYKVMGPHLILGLDVRYSEADVTLFDIERKAGGLNTGITLGYHF